MAAAATSHRHRRPRRARHALGYERRSQEACRSTASSRAAVATAVGSPLGLDAGAGRRGILRIANANMANALRLMTIARGHDPRRFALVAIGGAGPMHACALADELGIPRVVVPRYPGVAAALGLLATDIRHDLRRSWFQPTAARSPPPNSDAEFAALEAEARGAARHARRGQPPTTTFDFELDMRYRGQAYNLTVPFGGRPVTARRRSRRPTPPSRTNTAACTTTRPRSPRPRSSRCACVRSQAIPDIDWATSSHRGAVRRHDGAPYLGRRIGASGRATTP